MGDEKPKILFHDGGDVIRVSFDGEEPGVDLGKLVGELNFNPEIEALIEKIVDKVRLPASGS